MVHLLLVNSANKGQKMNLSEKDTQRNRRESLKIPHEQMWHSKEVPQRMLRGTLFFFILLCSSSIHSVTHIGTQLQPSATPIEAFISICQSCLVGEKCSAPQTVLPSTIIRGTPLKFKSSSHLFISCWSFATLTVHQTNHCKLLFRR